MEKIYLTTNLINGLKYVGRTSNKLYCENGSYIGSGKKLKLDIKKYGIENFTQILLEITDKENCVNIETKWILHYQSNNPLIGYNNDSNGGGRIAKSPEQKLYGKQCMIY